MVPQSKHRSYLVIMTLAYVRMFMLRKRWSLWSKQRMTYHFGWVTIELILTYENIF